MKTLTINVENGSKKRWIDGKLTEVGKCLNVINAKDNKGTIHSNQYRDENGKLYDYEGYKNMMKNRFKYDEIITKVIR